MPETDTSNKTEPPSPKKLKEAFEKGQFPRSPEVGTLAILFAGYMVLLLSGERAFSSLADFSRALFGGLADVEVSEATIIFGLSNSGMILVNALAPLLFAVTVAAVLSGGVQSLFKLTPKAIEMKAEKINPLAGLKRNFSMNSLVRFGTDLLKFAAFAAVVYGICMSRLQDPIFHVPTSITHLAQFMAATSRKMFQNLIVVMAGVASIHYSWQKFDHIRQMKMSRQELKDELKQTEGDPLLKAKLKQMGIRLRQRQMLDEVPFADVVITNPTHFAVALRYLSGKDAAPVILAKGKDRFAQRIKSFASEYGVPMVENRPAAQALYKMGEVGKPIPQALFKVVANILGHVYREHRYYFFRLRARREARESGPTQTYSPSSS